MYSPKTTEQQLALALPSARTQWQKISGRSNFELQRLTPQSAQQLTSALNALIDEKGQLKRPLTLEEQRCIINERTLCKWDARYYWSRYYKIEHVDGSGMTLFEPNIAQQIILDTWSEREDANLHIMQIHLKARQAGDTTLWQAAIAHRVQFHPDTRAVVGSSRPEKSTAMIDKALKAWGHVPWFLRPRMTRYKNGELIDFGVLNSSINIQHGAKIKSGAARGETPIIGHFSECCEYLNPSEDIDSAVLFAMHPSAKTLFGLESTAKGQENWWHYKWLQARDNWGVHPTLLQPVFLPWYVARDIYPTPTWLAGSPIPADWKPSSRTERHAKKAAEYVQNTPLISRYLGSTWNMPIEQQWYWESTRAEYQRMGELNKFYSELCIAGDCRVSTEFGMIPIREAQLARCAETGIIYNWKANGVRSVVRVKTKDGRELVCTPDHRVLLANGEWKQAQDLTGEKIALSAPRFASERTVVSWRSFPIIRHEVLIDENMGRFLGYFMGDGCYMAAGVQVCCFSEDEDVIADVQRLFKEITGRDSTGRKPRGKRMFLVESHAQFQWEPLMLAFGCIVPRYFPYKSSRNGFKRRVRVPECIWRSPKSVVKEFLSALFECDGHAYKRAAATRFFTKYEDFAKDVQLLLLGFGINAYIRREEKLSSTSNREYFYIGYEVRLNSKASDLFHERIDFIGARKRSGRRSSRLGRSSLPHVMEDTVTSIEPAGESDVYDLSLGDTHRFGTNGIMVHNCADDVEAFQHEGASVFDAELIMRYNELCKRPVAVYGINSSIEGEIRDELRPDIRQFQDGAKPLKIDAQREGGKTTYTLVPLKLDGYPIQFNPTGKLLIWELPQDGVEYGIGIDTAQGLGLDRSVCEVIRKATLTQVARQVAEFSSEWVSASDLFPYAHCLAKLYSRKDSEGNLKQPKIIVETNNGGDACQLALRKAGWGNLHAWMRYDKKIIDGSKANFLGAVTTTWSRDLVLGHLIKALRDGLIDIDSKWFITEMQTLVKDPDRAKIAATLGAHDDRFMAMGWIYLSMHILEFGEVRSAFGKGRILDDAELPKPAATRPPSPEELPIAADFVADRMIQHQYSATPNWWPGDGMDSSW